MKLINIIFDLDGTLSDPTEGIRNSFKYLFKKRNIEIDIDNGFSELVGPPLHSIFTEVLGWSAEESELSVKIFREYYGEKGVFENSIYPGISSMLEYLHDAGCKLYVATSKYETFAQKVLEHHKISGYFEKVSGASYSGSGASKIEIVKRILQTLPTGETQNTLMVGDRKFDIEAAQALGIKSLGVLYGFGSEDELRNAGADSLVNSVDELFKFLQGAKH